MQRTATRLILVTALLAAPCALDAATIQVTLNPVGSHDITIPVTGPPSVEFKAQQSDWGTITVNGAVVAHYVISSEDRMHIVQQDPYPGTWYRIVIRPVGPPSELLVLEGAASPGPFRGGVHGGVAMATGTLAFLRGATFSLLLSTTPTLLLTY